MMPENAAPMNDLSTPRPPAVSVVIPVCNEVDNVGTLAREIVAALQSDTF